MEEQFGGLGELSLDPRNCEMPLRHPGGNADEEARRTSLEFRLEV